MHFTHCAAHGDTTDKVVNVKSEQLLDELEVRYPQVFKEPTYPIIENRVPFTIPLVDSTIPPPKRKLYPLSELELEELQS